MAPRRRPRTTTAALALANLLLPLALLVFATGFFPYKPVLPGLAGWDEEDWADAAGAGVGVDAEGGVGAGPGADAPFDKLVFMVVDALRSDFVFGKGGRMGFVQSLIREGSAIPFTAHATPPTVTMPRVKALTTGGVPGFLDLILNFAEGDGEGGEGGELGGVDSWLAQLRRKGLGLGLGGEEGETHGGLVFYGDDTWLKLFPGEFFGRAEGTSSFFVSDFTQVDTNVTRHLPSELLPPSSTKPEWTALITHYLGLDHIGHKTGPAGPAMLPKQREMDAVFRLLYEAVEAQEHLRDTLIVLVGDHGMNAGGNHGGSGPGETEPALVFASPKFASPREAPAEPREGTEFEFYRKVQQSDVVPTLAGLLGFPVPRNSLGVVLGEVCEGLLGAEGWGRLLRRNARQVRGVVEAGLGAERWRGFVGGFGESVRKSGCEGVADGEEEEMACLWARAVGLKGLEGEAEALLAFLYKAQDALSSTASSYDVPRMAAGIAIAGASLLLAVLAFPGLWPPTLAGCALVIVTGLYGVMMFASSYVEEEQHFWYWTTPAWLALLAVRSLQQGGSRLSLPNGLSIPRALLVIPLLASHRLMLRWNQTGQKHAGAPDVAHAFFPDHHILMWFAVLGTYLLVGAQLTRSSFKGVLLAEAAVSTAFVMVLPAVVFKLNFTQADAPELVLGLGERVRAFTAGMDLVAQARVVFVMLVLATGIVVVGSTWKNKKTSAREAKITLADRLHPLLTLFLVTQTRAPNVPLFFLLELQRSCFARLLLPPTPTPNSKNHSQALPIALTSLLLSQTTYFAFGGSNSISSIDLSNAYNGVADYNIVAVGILLFADNWAGAVWWCSAAVTLLLPRPESPAQSKDGSRAWIAQEREKLRTDAAGSAPEAGGENEGGSSPWTIYITATTLFSAGSLVAVMAACTLLRTHLFIWTVFSPKYLYAMAWAVGWHLIVSVGLGWALWGCGGVV